MRRGAHGQRIEQEAEPEPLLLGRDVEQVEDAGLQRRLVDPEGAPRELDAVAHDVVRKGPHSSGIVEQSHGLLVRPREGVVHRRPAALLLVPLEQREVRDPEEPPRALVDQAELSPQTKPQGTEDASDQLGAVGAEKHGRPGL